MKKIISMILICCMGIGILTGCGKDSKVSYDPDNFMTEEEATAAGNPYQIVKEKVTIKIFVPRGSTNPEYSTMRMFQVLSEVTNLEFEFVEAAIDQYETLRSVAWEDKKNTPDLFLYYNTISEIVSFSEMGVLTPFNDPEYTKDGVKIGSLIDNYMPTYKALLESDFGHEGLNATDVVTMDDGYMYSVANVTDVLRDIIFKQYLNQQWIDNINNNFITDASKKLPNASDIKTIEEYIRVLRAFKEYDANLNGDATDEIPVTSDSMNYLRNMLLSSYGYVSNWMEISNDGENFVFVPATETYKKYIETATTLYKDGIIDNNTFSNTNTTIVNKGFEDCLGSFSGAAAFQLVGDELDENYVTVGPFTSEYYNGEPITYSTGMIDALGAVIPSSTPYAREIARLLDIMYSDLGVQLLAYGQEGVDWKWTDDTESAWVRCGETEDATDSEKELYRAQLTPQYGLAVGLYNSFDFVGKEAEGYSSRLNKLCERYASSLKEPIPQYIHLTKDEYQKESLYGTTLQNYIEESEFQFITGVMSVEKDWDSYVSKLESYHYKEVEQIYNDALARYKGGK